jgi:hypothetical protein
LFQVLVLIPCSLGDDAGSGDLRMSTGTAEAEVTAWLSSLGMEAPSIDAFKEALNGSPAAKFEAASSLQQTCVITRSDLQWLWDHPAPIALTRPCCLNLLCLFAGSKPTMFVLGC